MGILARWVLIKNQVTNNKDWIYGEKLDQRSLVAY